MKEKNNSNAWISAGIVVLVALIALYVGYNFRSPNLAPSGASSTGGSSPPPVACIEFTSSGGYCGDRMGAGGRGWEADKGAAMAAAIRSCESDLEARKKEAEECAYRRELECDAQNCAFDLKVEDNSLPCEVISCEPSGELWYCIASSGTYMIKTTCNKIQ